MLYNILKPCVLSAVFLITFSISLSSVYGGGTNKTDKVTAFRIEIKGNQHTLISMLTKKDVLRMGLPTQAVLGEMIDNQDQAAIPEYFVQNKKFVEFLHDFIRQYAPNDPGFKKMAKRKKRGYIYVVDQRCNEKNIDDISVEDLLGFFKIEDGKIVRDSYERFRSHRIMTEKGFFRLSKTMEARLLKELRNLPPVKSGG